MTNSSQLQTLSELTESILQPPFEWCYVPGGPVLLEDATGSGGTQGGIYYVDDFAIAKYPITNAQYEKFIQHPNGFCKPQWWGYSEAAMQWRKDHQHPRPTAFGGGDLPRTRVGWFDNLAFCLWLSSELTRDLHPAKPLDIRDVSIWLIRLPTEQEWQRAALGDTGWRYPWGDTLDEMRANYGNKIGQPTRVTEYVLGQSIYGAMDLTGNVWERCLTGWNQQALDLSGYTYRVIKGGAWNVSNPDHLRSDDRACHPPRGELNDCGFRVSLCYRPLQP